MKVEVDSELQEYYIATNHNKFLINYGSQTKMASIQAGEEIDKMSEKNETFRKEMCSKVKREKQKKNLEEMYPKFRSANNSTIIKEGWLKQKRGKKDRLRHAEEFLCDIADKLTKQNSSPYRFTIYGKKRPCLTCAARMRISKIDVYNQHHGRFFLHAINYMTEEHRFEALKLLLEGPTHVSQEGITDYDTDSEEDEPPKFDHLFLFGE